MSKFVYLTHPLQSDLMSKLSSCCELRVGQAGFNFSADAAPEEWQNCCGIICLLTDRIDRTLLDKMPALEFVSSVSVGVDHVDVQALTSRGIALGHTPGVLVDATADTAFALLLAAARRVAEGDRYVRAGRWLPDAPWSPQFFLGKDIAGATLGIVGLGAIGQAVARRASGFGMRVIAWNRTAREIAGIESVELDELLRLSDFVSVHVALTPETRGLIDVSKIALMRSGSILINTARGGIVDETALVEGLDSGRLFAAGLDVYEQEPLPQNSRLLQHPRVVLVPHIGSATEQTRQAMVERAIENALAALRGECMPFCANAEALS